MAEKLTEIIPPKRCEVCGEALKYSSEFRLIYCSVCDIPRFRHVKQVIGTHVHEFDYETPTQPEAIINRAYWDRAYRLAIMKGITPMFSRFMKNSTLILQFDTTAGPIDLLLLGVIKARRDALGQPKRPVKFVFYLEELESLVGNFENGVVVISFPAMRHCMHEILTMLRRQRCDLISLTRTPMRPDFTLLPFGTKETQARGLVKTGWIKQGYVQGYVVVEYDMELRAQWDKEKAAVYQKLCAEGVFEMRGDRIGIGVKRW